MPTIDPRASTLLIVDFQARLMPVIDHGDRAILNARRLLDASTLFDVPCLLTEQNTRGLGPTVAELTTDRDAIFHKMTFDATRTQGFILPDSHAVVVAGCEAHVCVLQTVLGLIHQGRRVFVVRDALGSRQPESKEAAIRRMERHGAEIVTTEMVIFEWLGTAAHPKFREAIRLIK